MSARSDYHRLRRQAAKHMKAFRSTNDPEQFRQAQIFQQEANVAFQEMVVQDNIERQQKQAAEAERQRRIDEINKQINDAQIRHTEDMKRRYGQ